MRLRCSQADHDKYCLLNDERPKFELTIERKLLDSVPKEHRIGFILGELRICVEHLLDLGDLEKKYGDLNIQLDGRLS